jgi:hypothetical protein
MLACGRRRALAVFGRMKGKTTQRLAKTRQSSGLPPAADLLPRRVIGYYFPTFAEISNMNVPLVGCVALGSNRA